MTPSQSSSSSAPYLAGNPLLKIDFPPAFGYEGLSELLGRSITSLQCDRTRKPESLPPACTPPGTKSPRWLLTDVLAWLAEYREPKVKQRPAKPGRPTKSQQIAVRRAGQEAI